MYHPPRRIASLLPGATEMLFGLGLGERVVAVSHECDFPLEAAWKPRVTFSHVDSTAASGAIDRQVRDLLAAGEPLYGVDAEQLAELRPELIVTQAQCDVCAVRYDDVLAAVAGRPELRDTQVLAQAPESLDEVFADIAALAAAAGCEEAGAAYLAEFRGRVEAVEAETDRLSDGQRMRVACIEWIDPLMLAGNWMPGLIQLAGGRQPAVVETGHSRYTDWDAVVEFDPQVVVVMPCGFNLERSVREVASLAARPGWAELAAVRDGKVYAVDAGALFNRAGPRLVESLELLAFWLRRSSRPNGESSPPEPVPTLWRPVDGITQGG